MTVITSLAEFVEQKDALLKTLDDCIDESKILLRVRRSGRYEVGDDLHHRLCELGQRLAMVSQQTWGAE